MSEECTLKNIINCVDIKKCRNNILECCVECYDDYSCKNTDYVKKCHDKITENIKSNDLSTLLTLFILVLAFICILKAIKKFMQVRQRELSIINLEENRGLNQYTQVFNSTVSSQPKFTNILNSESTCSICLEVLHNQEKPIKILPCNHCFHQDCIEEWYKSSEKCPLCNI